MHLLRTLFLLLAATLTHAFAPANGDALKSAVDKCLKLDNTGKTCCAYANGDVTAASTCPAGTTHISNWDTSQVTSMQEMFHSEEDFNADISAWDTSQVTNMETMFYYALSFNHDIGNWDTSRVTNMYAMFYYTKDFKADISCWNTNKVTSKAYFSEDSALTSCDSPFGRPSSCDPTFQTESGCATTCPDGTYTPISGKKCLDECEAGEYIKAGTNQCVDACEDDDYVQFNDNQCKTAGDIGGCSSDVSSASPSELLQALSGKSTC